MSLRLQCTVSLCTLLAAFEHATPAHAFVRLRTNVTEAELYWGGPLVLTPDDGGAPEIGGVKSRQQIEQAAENWLGALADCSGMQIRVEPSQPSPGRAIDGENAVVWLEDQWGTTIDGQFVPYGDGAVALTTLTFRDEEGRSDNGQIVDADLEINGVGIVFGITGDSAPGALDVQAVVTHEIGHALGLGHTCWDGIDPPMQPIDHEGRPIPDCFSDVPAEVAETTMYPYTTADDTRQRSPEADDIAGICAIYPPREEADDGCALANSRSGPSGLAAALAMALYISRRRARRSFTSALPRAPSPRRR